MCVIFTFLKAKLHRATVTEANLDYEGSITIDGISLTVNEVNGNVLGFSLIPETLKLTTLGSLQTGDLVNVEADVMAKHIEKLMDARL
ncbi:MAG: hypothetical protein EB036_08950, partial [Betaproteobacteria bacterium]|nr:hypothetical protein [Betaproteobacteria bacterium]